MNFAAKQGSSASCGCAQTGCSTVTIEGAGAVRVGLDKATGTIQGGIASVTIEGLPISTERDPVNAHLDGLHKARPTTANAARTVMVGSGDLASRHCANPVGKGGCLDFQRIQLWGAITGQDGVHFQRTQPVSQTDIDRHAYAAKYSQPVVINVRKVSASGEVDSRPIRIAFMHGAAEPSARNGRDVLTDTLSALRDANGKMQVTSISVFSMCFQAQNYDSLNLALDRLRQPDWQRWAGRIIDYHIGEGWQKSFAKLSPQEQQAIWSKVRGDIATQLKWIRDHIPFPDTVGQSSGGVGGYYASDTTNFEHSNNLPNPVPGLQE